MNRGLTRPPEHLVPAEREPVEKADPMSRGLTLTKDEVEELLWLDMVEKTDPMNRGLTLLHQLLHRSWALGRRDRSDQ